MGRDLVEGRFEDVLKRLVPSQDLVELAGECFQRAWDNRVLGTKAQRATLERQIKDTDRKINLFVDRIADPSSADLITVYEERVRDLKYEKAALVERIAECGRALPDFDATFRTALDFLANPCALWASRRFEDRQAVLKLVFADHLAYDPEGAFEPLKQPYHSRS